MAGVCAEHGRRKNGDGGMGKRNPIALSSPSRFHLCNCTIKYPYSTRAPVNLNATLNCLAFSSHLQEMSPHFQLYCQLLISLGSCAVFQSRDCERQRINQTNSMAPGSGLLWDWWTAGMCNLWFGRFSWSRTQILPCNFNWDVQPLGLERSGYETTV